MSEISKKKIVIFINRLAVGGAERLVVDTINYLNSLSDVEVKLVTIRPEIEDQSIVSDCRLKAGQHEFIDVNSLFDLRGIFKIYKFLRQYKPNVIFSHLWFSNSIVRIANIFSKISKLIIFEHNVYDTVKSKKQFFLDKVLQKFCYKILAVSKAVENSLVKHDIDKDKITVVPNAVNVSRYQNIEKDKLDELKLELNIKDNDFVYIFIGRLIKQKAVDILLKSFSLVDRGHLLIIGDGEEKKELKKLTSNRVHFLGIRSDIPELLAISDCFVLPSRHEGMPIVLLEAIAANKAIVTSDFGASKEILENNKSGLIVPKENVEQLAEALNKVQADSELRNLIVKNVSELSNKYSIETHVEKILDLANS